MNTDLAIWVVGALGLIGGIGSAVKAILDRRSTRAKANLDDASATTMLTAAAREMLDPLRAQLVEVRAEHALERETDRREVVEVRTELAACKAEARELRNELAMARVEADALRRERETDRARIRVLEDLLNRG